MHGRGVIAPVLADRLLTRARGAVLSGAAKPVRAFLKVTGADSTDIPRVPVAESTGVTRYVSTVPSGRRPMRSARLPRQHGCTPVVSTGSKAAFAPAARSTRK